MGLSEHRKQCRPEGRFLTQEGQRRWTGQEVLRTPKLRHSWHLKVVCRMVDIVGKGEETEGSDSKGRGVREELG